MNRTVPLPPILPTRQDGVLTITLNRAEARNALSESLMRALQLSLDEAEEDRDVRVVVIAAKGKHFTVGLDLKAFGSIAGGGYRDTTRIAAGPAAMWREILLENRAGLLAGLGDFSAMLDKMKAMILEGDASGLELFLEQARAIREDLP